MNYKLLIFLVSFCLLILPTFGHHKASPLHMDIIKDNEANEQNFYTFTPPKPGDLITDEVSPFDLFLDEFSISSYESEVFQPVVKNYDLTDIIQEIDKKMVLEFIENITSFGPRVTGSSSCEKAGRWIFQEFQDMRLQVKYHNWSTSSTMFGSNIEATLPGANPNSDEIYVVCGHYDSVFGSPGADDNAAGTAAVLSAAEAMNDYSFQHTVRFVTFSGEEQGLYGSYHYAKEAYENEDNIVAVLNADMMGYASDEVSESKVVVFDNEPSAWIRQVSTDISSSYGDLVDLEIVHGGSSGRSDHASFHSFGYDAIFYFEYEMNPHYHSTQDTIENMNPWYASNVSRLILATISELSGYVPQLAPETPDKPSGRKTGRIDNEYTYETRTIDPNADTVFYKWSWGDNSSSDWLGPFESNEICSVNHAWSTEGDFEVKVKAKDSLGAESDWSDPLTVTMPKSSVSSFFNFIFEQVEWIRSIWQVIHR